MEEEDLVRVQSKEPPRAKTAQAVEIEVVPPQRDWDVKLSPIERRILQAWFKERPVARYARLAIRKVSRNLNVTERRVVEVIKTANAEAEAKRQQEAITEKVYGQKIPAAKEIVGYSLNKLLEFVKEARPTTWDDAQKITKIATDLQMLLRLELGQATQKIDIDYTTKTERSISVIIDDLSKSDPFVDYPAITDGKDEG